MGKQYVSRSRSCSRDGARDPAPEMTVTLWTRIIRMKRIEPCTLTIELRRAVNLNSGHGPFEARLQNFTLFRGGVEGSMPSVRSVAIRTIRVQGVGATSRDITSADRNRLGLNRHSRPNADGRVHRGGIVHFTVLHDVRHATNVGHPL